MKGLRKFCGLFLLVVSASAVSAQKSDGLPQLKKGESYKSVRAKMIKAGWKPYHAPDAEECAANDKRCENRPEMQQCAAEMDEAPCVFLWKRKGKTFVITTVGIEKAVYRDGTYYKVQ